MTLDAERDYEGWILSPMSAYSLNVLRQFYCVLQTMEKPYSMLS